MRHRNLVALFAAVACTLAVGCTDAGTPVIILQNQYPTEGCLVQASQSSLFLSAGRLDIRADHGYWLFPLVENNAEAEGSGSERVLLVEGADIQVRFQAGFLDDVDDALLNYTDRFSGTVAAKGGTTAFSVNAIRPALLEAVREAGRLPNPGDSAVMELEVKIFGTIDGGRVDSVPFVYPITLSRERVMRDHGNCSSVDTSQTFAEGWICSPYYWQDAEVDCCTDDDGVYVCPPVPAGTPPT